jgi:hypothetical protein
MAQYTLTSYLIVVWIVHLHDNSYLALVNTPLPGQHCSLPSLLSDIWYVMV